MVMAERLRGEPKTALTPQECRVVREVAKAKSNREIAIDLQFTEGTVKQYLNRAMRKLHMHNRTEVAVWLMRSLSIIALSAVVTLAQGSQLQLVLDTANPSPLVPGTVILDAQITAFPSPAPAAMQFSIALPLGSAATGVLFGAVSTTTKQLQCATVSGSLNCIIYSLDATPIPSGLTFARITFTSVPVGTFNAVVSGPLLADPAGVSIPVTAAPALPIVIVAPISACDLNQDGKIDALDVANAALQAIRVTACTNANLAADGCTVIDVQRIIAASLPGGICKVGQ